MFEKWRAKQSLQAQCLHEWHVVNNYEGLFYIRRMDLYCGICDKTRRRVLAEKARTIIEIQKIRKKYEERGATLWSE